MFFLREYLQANLNFAGKARSRTRINCYTRVGHSLTKSYILVREGNKHSSLLGHLARIQWYKTFTLCCYCFEYKASVFIPSEYFQPSSDIYKKGWEHNKEWILVSASKIRQERGQTLQLICPFVQLSCPSGLLFVAGCCSQKLSYCVCPWQVFSALRA